MSKSRRRDYGSGSVYRRRDGYWAASIELGWINSRRKRKTVTAKTKAQAVEKLKELQHRLHTGTTITTGQTPTLGEWLQEWLDTMAAPRVAPRTLHSHRSAIDRHITPVLGHVRLDKLTPMHILRLHQALRATKRPEYRGGGTLRESTVLRTHAVLSRALTDAMRHGYIPTNPAQRVDRPTAKSPEPKFLNLDQASMLLRAVADDPYGSRWAFALLTGQRQGEVLGLRWSHVDLDQGLADIAWKLERPGFTHGCLTPCGRQAGHCPQRQLVMPPGREHVPLDGLALTRPKSGVHKMVVLIPPLVAWLRRHREEQPSGVHDLVWAHPDGRPVDPRRDDYYYWTGLLDRLDLPPVTLHSMRHTCVTLLLSLGVQEIVIRQMVGHSTIAASQRYMHTDKASAMEAATRLGQALQLEG